MPATAIPVPDYITEALELLVHESMPLNAQTLVQAAQACGNPVSPDDAAKIVRRVGVQDAFAALEQRANERAGDAATESKAVIAGRLHRLADKLTAFGTPQALKSAGELYATEAKVLGLLNDGATVNIMDGISGSDIESAKEAIRARREAEQRKSPN